MGVEVFAVLRCRMNGSEPDDGWNELLAVYDGETAAKAAAFDAQMTDYPHLYEVVPCKSVSASRVTVTATALEDKGGKKEEKLVTTLQSSAMTISVNEACAALGISRNLIYTLIGEGKLVSVKMGRRTMIRISDLQAFANNLPRTIDKPHQAAR